MPGLGSVKETETYAFATKRFVPFERQALGACLGHRQSAWRRPFELDSCKVAMEPSMWLNRVEESEGHFTTGLDLNPEAPGPEWDRRLGIPFALEVAVA
jgi:hypothetical protein